MWMCSCLCVGRISKCSKIPGDMSKSWGMQTKKIYVLDDSRKHTSEHKQLAHSFGFEYIERPNKGWFKKSGNIAYGFEHSTGDFIAIFDADFAPHKDFIHDLLPYMQEEKVGIVQSPQYFLANDKVYKHSHLEYGAAFVQESFYRFIQVARSRMGGTVCCGSNALYRRSALKEIDGVVLAEHSEDILTGFKLRKLGYDVLYVPVILATGVCPDDVHTYFNQQHRWSMGSVDLIFSKEFWTSKIPFKTKFAYFTGLLFYIQHPAALLFSFQLFLALFIAHGSATLRGGVYFYPFILWGILVVVFFSIARFKIGSFLALGVQLAAYSHSTLTFFHKSSDWLPTNVKSKHITWSFIFATLGIALYFLGYIALLFFSLQDGSLPLWSWQYAVMYYLIAFNVAIMGSTLAVMLFSMDDRRAIEEDGYSARSTFKLSLLLPIAIAVLFLFVFAPGLYQRYLVNPRLEQVAAERAEKSEAIVSNLENRTDKTSSLSLATPTETTTNITASLTESAVDLTNLISGSSSDATEVSLATTSESTLPDKDNTTPIESPYTFARTLKWGERSEDVLSMQEFLVAEGYLNKKYTTGYFGNITYYALVAYQRDHKIRPAQGVFGPITRSYVQSSVAVKENY